MTIPITHDDRAGPADALGRQVVDFARRAPSVHNTQPWAWHIDGRRLDLYADRSRQLAATDADARSLVLSCGAALHYAEAGAAALGWLPTTERLAAPGSDHLATIHLAPRPASRAATAHAELLRSRITDRRRFIGWPVPETVLASLAEAGHHGAASTVVVSGNVARLRVELLTSRAMSVERADPRFADEQEHWTEDGTPRTDDGVPAANATPGTLDHQTSAWPTRFDPTREAAVLWDGRRPVPPTDGLLVVTTTRDEPDAWLDAGDVLCRLWVAAMEHGLSLVPSSQLTEVPETREGLRVGVLDRDRHPALLLRVGWQELGRSPLPPTPRRPLDDLLR